MAEEVKVQCPTCGRMVVGHKGHALDCPGGMSLAINPVRSHPVDVEELAEKAAREITNLIARANRSSAPWPTSAFAAIISSVFTTSLGFREGVEVELKPCTGCGNLFRYPPSDNKEWATECAYCAPPLPSGVQEEDKDDPGK